MLGAVPAPEAVILLTVQKHNILPLTSHCNVSCMFCSHRQNPAGVAVYTMEPRAGEEVVRLFPYLDPGRKIVIGESATCLVEGEPLTHPDFFSILAMLRERFPGTPVEITTNGSLLGSRGTAMLAGLDQVQVNLSLNSADPGVRRRLMHDPAAEQAIAAPPLLQACKVPFHGSVVAMPWVTGWEDLRRTILYLADYGARTVRIFLPGYTRLAPEALRFGPELWEQLHLTLKELAGKTSVPLTLEPPFIDDLTARLEGVLAGSPADLAGIRRGDEIVAVDGEPAFSRVDAFQKVQKKAASRIRFLREGRMGETAVLKQAGDSSGLVMSYDLDPEIPVMIVSTVRRHRARSPLVLCSPLGEKMLRAGLTALSGKGPRVWVHPVSSRFFGGSIRAAGLLVVDDFRKAYSEWQARFAGRKADLILLPGIAFNHLGQDLTGENYWSLSGELGCQVSALP